MNIKITYNWLLEYLDTDATPYEIQKYLSLCGPSIERINPTSPRLRGASDYVFDIEITSNRVDTASVLGIAQEAQAILPRFNKKAKLKNNPLEQFTFKSLSLRSRHDVGRSNLLNIHKFDHKLCQRFAALVLNIKLGPSPQIIQDRLTMCDIKSINNVVDISNYLMLALGQPVHIFDYDKIVDHKMILRESKKGETIVTLDNKKIVLPGGDIVIEDGSGKLIDLCGIMGGLNSAVNDKTKRIVLFVQTYHKQNIRKTSMTTNQRTVAATYFEKGLDSERVESTLVYGVQLLEKYAQGKIIGPLQDIYPHPYQTKYISISFNDINKKIGISIPSNEVIEIMSNLGFTLPIRSDRAVLVKLGVPSYRSNDIDIKEDIIEEVARIYGYFNLPNKLSPPAYVAQPKEFALLFKYSYLIKHFLKNIGLHETLNYSMISEKMIKNLNLNFKDHLNITNTISEEIKYLRRSLIPSLIKNIQDNQGKRSILKFFEIAKVYHSQVKDLPQEIYKLGIVTNTDFFDLKGIIEALLREVNIVEYQIEIGKNSMLSKNIQAELKINNKVCGFFGQLKSEFQQTHNLKDKIFLAEFDFYSFINQAKLIPVYKPINQYAVIKLDLTIKLSEKLNYAKIKSLAFKNSKLLDQIELIDQYQDNITLRFYFTSSKRNITEEEAKKELNIIKSHFSS